MHNSVRAGNQRFSPSGQVVDWPLGAAKAFWTRFRPRVGPARHRSKSSRGPTKCRTYIDDDLIIVLMRGGFSRLENTLFEDGKFLDVRATRHAFQDTMEGRFTEVIERLTGREVAAFMSASHQRRDLQMEVFILDGGSDPNSVDLAS